MVSKVMKLSQVNAKQSLLTKGTDMDFILKCIL